MKCKPVHDLVPVFMTVADGSPTSLIVVATNFPHGTRVPVQPIL